MANTTESAQFAAATLIAEHQRIPGKSGQPCWCGRWPDHQNRDRQGWNEHVAEELAAAGLLVSTSPGGGEA